MAEYKLEDYENITYNGSDKEKVIYNGVTVWEKIVDIEDGIYSYSADETSTAVPTTETEEIMAAINDNKLKTIIFETEYGSFVPFDDYDTQSILDPEGTSYDWTVDYSLDDWGIIDNSTYENYISIDEGNGDISHSVKLYGNIKKITFIIEDYDDVQTGIFTYQNEPEDTDTNIGLSDVHNIAVAGLLGKIKRLTMSSDSYSFNYIEDFETQSDVGPYGYDWTIDVELGSWGIISNSTNEDRVYVEGGNLYHYGIVNGDKTTQGFFQTFSGESFNEIEIEIE